MAYLFRRPRGRNGVCNGCGKAVEIRGQGLKGKTTACPLCAARCELGAYQVGWTDPTGRRRKRSARTYSYQRAMRFLREQAGAWESGAERLPSDLPPTRQLITAFLDDLRATGRPETVVHNWRAYRARMEHLAAFMDAEAIRSIAQLRHAHMLRFRGQLRAKGYRPRTVNNSLRAALRLVNWLVENEQLAAPPFTLRKRDYLPVSPPSTRHVGLDLQAFLDECARCEYRAGQTGVMRTDPPVVAWFAAIAAGAGFRLEELRALTPSNFDMTQEVILPGQIWRGVINLRPDQAKGKKHGRVVPIDPDIVRPVVEDMLAWWAQHPNGWDGVPHASPFPWTQGRGVRRQLTRVSERMGLDAAIGPHDLRKWFLTYWGNRGASDILLARIAGHQDPKELRPYTHGAMRQFTELAGQMGRLRRHTGD